MKKIMIKFLLWLVRLLSTEKELEALYENEIRRLNPVRAIVQDSFYQLAQFREKNHESQRRAIAQEGLSKSEVEERFLDDFLPKGSLE